jgi:hypothetical protein
MYSVYLLPMLPVQTIPFYDTFSWFHTVAKKGAEKNAVEVDGSKLQGRFTGIFTNG